MRKNKNTTKKRQEWEWEKREETKGNRMLVENDKKTTAGKRHKKENKYYFSTIYLFTFYLFKRKGK